MILIIIIIIIIPYLLVYKSTPPFLRSKIGFFIILVREVKFRQIEISQKVNLLFLGIYWKHGVLKKAAEQNVTVCFEVYQHLSISLRFKSVSTRAPGSRATCHLTDFYETLPVLRVYPKTQKDKLVSVLVFFRGEIDQPPGFSWFSPRKSLQNR